MARVLVVEDDEAIAPPLVRALEREGYEVEHVLHGRDAADRVSAGGVDLMLLDLTLPDVDGIEVCRQVRAKHPALPIVMLTARGSELDIVVGFDAGADDYIPKPFSLAELIARLRARLRGQEPGAGTSPRETRGVRVDLEAHRAWRDDREIELTRKEFDLLVALLREAGRVVPRDRIMREVWAEEWWGRTRTLDMHISSLRRKLGDDPADPELITTVRGVGFRFELD